VPDAAVPIFTFITEWKRPGVSPGADSTQMRKELGLTAGGELADR